MYTCRNKRKQKKANRKPTEHTNTARRKDHTTYDTYDTCRANSIHPLFVFSGLSLIRKDKPHVNDDNKMAKRTAAWEAVNSSKIEQALSYWTSSYSVHQPDLIHLVIRILKEHGIDYMRAPYGAGPQVNQCFV